jgi:hypothetical protein
LAGASGDPASERHRFAFVAHANERARRRSQHSEREHMHQDIRIAAVCGLVCIAAAGCIDAASRMGNCPATPGGGTVTAAASAPPKGCPTGAHAAPDGLIDDFEDGDTQVAKQGDRDGYWFTAHDDKGSTINPTPLKIADGGAGSAKAIHVDGKTAAGDGAWGSQLGVNFLSKGLYDASKYAGISFKAKIGSGSANKVRLKVGDVNTHPDGGVCKSCWNHFGKDIPLTTDWQEFKVTFADMKQEAGWGDPVPAITPSKLVSINWSIGPSGAFDLWIDDLQFIVCN